MQFHTYIFAESAWVYRLLRLGPRRISLTGAKVRIEGQFGVISLEIPILSINEVTLQRSCFWRELTIHLVDGGERSIGGLAEREAANVRDAILEKAAKIAESLGKRLKHLVKQLSAKRYIRHSDSLEIHKQLVSLVAEIRGCGKLVHECLDQGAEEALGRLEQLESVKVFERVRRNLNDLYIRRALPSVKAAAGADLTDEQAEAIATDEDVTLVLAGAGTGKTKVIVGKVAHLVRNQAVDPSGVLVLAFNDKAAKEIRQRLSKDFSETRVFTFHSFGNNVIAESQDKKPTVSDLAIDEKKLRSVVDNSLKVLLRDPQQSQVVINFIVNHRNPRHSAFEFKTVSEYRQYVNSIELRTLNGDIVKSQEELEIANFLTISGIDFVYEQPYTVDTANRQYRQYSPDFFLPEYDIYIEHFALSEEGQPPPGWDEYAKGVEWKRSIHRQNNTTLIETFSWQFRQGVLLKTLRSKLEIMGVEFKRISTEELVERLGEERLSWLSKLLITFLDHVRGGNLKLDDLQTRALKLKERDERRDTAFLKVFEQVLLRYEKVLENSNKIDFHDQINLAVKHIHQGSWEPPFRYVLVDEFQDISRGRMRLLQSLMGRNVAYFLVGDDWQSIYRFTGSDVKLVHNVSDYLGYGYVQERTLSKTFRFRNGILGPSTTFIKRNREEQSQRILTTASSMEDQGITIISDENSEGLQWALRSIESIANGESHSVLVLARYNRTLQALPKGQLNRSFKSLRLEFSTVHSAKGREEDYVVVLDLKDDRWGFPSKVEDDPLLDIVLPPVSSKSYPFAEERRLFYVAVTRAKIGAFLVTDSTRPSAFVEELQTYHDITKVGKFAERCPKCRVGFLIKRPGPRGLFIGCTEYGTEPSCRYTKNIEAKRDDKLEADNDDQFWDRILDTRSR